MIAQKKKKAAAAAAAVAAACLTLQTDRHREHARI
jgi:hypothetical protein